MSRETEQLAALDKTHLNQETARVSWKEIERFFATGHLVSVSPDLDLVDVALLMARDDVDQLADLKAKQQFALVSDHQAIAWQKDNIELWAVVIKPWILVQPA